MQVGQGCMWGGESPGCGPPLLLLMVTAGAAVGVSEWTGQGVSNGVAIAIDGNRGVCRECGRGQDGGCGVL